MRVAFYFDNRHLGHWAWDAFVRGQVPTSGTDGQFLHLLHRMVGRDDVDAVPLFCGHLPDGAPAGAREVGELPDGVQIAKEFGCDLILFNNRGCDESLRGLARCDEVGLPAIVWDQNGPFPEVRDAFYSARALKRLVVVSQSQANTLRGRPLFDKVAVIWNSLLFDMGGNAGFEDRGDRVCFLGATVSEKGFHHLVKSWPEVRRTRPSAELIIMGSSRLYARGRAVGPLGLGNPEFERDHIVPYWGDSEVSLERLGVHLMGLLPPSGVRDVLKRCAIAVVNPCVRNGSYETFCVSAIEAQAAGCAVVGGRRLGLRETVRHGETGILIRREKDLAPTIIGLLGDPARARVMGVTGSRWVRETFSTTEADARWVGVFADVVTGRPNQAPPLNWRLIGLRSIVRICLSLDRKLSEIIGGPLSTVRRSYA